MIKHGKIHKTYGRKPMGRHSHLRQIQHFVTKGVADALEGIVLHPLACDVKGAKRFNAQQCVIAKALTRVLKPQAVVVGRSMAFVVMDGLAIRFEVPLAAREAIEEFDTRGRVHRAPIELRKVPASQRLTEKAQYPETRKMADRVYNPKMKRMKKIGVRAVGGGVTI